MRLSWNPNTEQGKMVLDALLTSLKTARALPELRVARKTHPILSQLSWGAVYQKCKSEAEKQEPDAIGAEWKRLCAASGKSTPLLTRYLPTPELQKEFSVDWPTMPLEDLVAKYKLEGTTASQRHQLALNVKAPPRKLRGAGSRKDKGTVKVEHEKQEERPPELKLRKLDEPAVFEIDRDTWDESLACEGNISRIDYGGPGFRRWMLETMGYLSVWKAPRYFNIAGGLVSGKGVQSRINALMAEYGKKQKSLAIEHAIEEIAFELASMLPKIKKPKGVEDNGSNGYVRYYVYPSTPFGGPYEQQIAERMREIRLSKFGVNDIRVEKDGGARRWVKGVKLIHRIITPKKSRLPSQYHSTSAEKEIRVRDERGIKKAPDFDIVGTFASSLHVPQGIRRRPYITVPALSHLDEEAAGAENQVGLTFVHYNKAGDRSVFVWSLKDMIMEERKAISAPRDASEIQKHIVELFKEQGALSIGLITDHLSEPPYNLKIDRATVEKEIAPLVTEKELKNKTWPGLYYNPHSQSYDFHLNWIQERLYVPFPKKEDFEEDTSLSVACTHVGYRTSDYPFLAKRLAKIILERNVRILRIDGDVTAGLKHGFAVTGELIGGLNNTDQERFAGELFATAIEEVVRTRLKQLLGIAEKENEKISSEKLENLLDQAMPLVLFIPGNHDLWILEFGVIPLSEFRHILTSLLKKYLTQFLVKRGLPAANVDAIIEKKIIGFEDFRAEYELPSKIRIEMQHQHLGGAKTTSLRLQETIGKSDCQVLDLANFHAATSDHAWDPDRGQCVGLQIGSNLLYTPFERRKGKRKVDFGAVFLRTLSYKGRIWMTETAFYNQPTIQEPYKAAIDVDALKKELGILGYK